MEDAGSHSSALHITKKIPLIKLLISYFSDFRLACIPLFQFIPPPLAVGRPSSTTKWSHQSILLHFHPFILTASDKILTAALFFMDSVRMSISYIALSPRNPLPCLHRTNFKLPPAFLQLT